MAAEHVIIDPYFFALIAALVLQFTRFGRTIYAIGGNEQSARLMGLPVVRTKILAYVISGTCAGLAGVVFAALFTIMVTTTLIRMLGRAAGGRVDTASLLPLSAFASLRALPVLLVLAIYVAVLMTITRAYRDLLRGRFEQRLRLRGRKRLGPHLGREQVAELDQQERLAAPVGIGQAKRLRVDGTVALDQQIGDDVGIDDDHWRPAAIAASMASAVSGPPRRRFTGLGNAAALPSSRSTSSCSCSARSSSWWSYSGPS